MSTDLETRVRRLEDRVAISECVINYARAVDAKDWEMFGSCFTDPTHVDYSEAGMPAADRSRTELAEMTGGAIGGFTATQHISPNHVVEFDEDDPDRAVCYSYMFAQHLLEDAPSGDRFLLRGSYDNHMRRTAEGWKIERLVQHVSWPEGNTNAVAEAMERLQA